MKFKDLFNDTVHETAFKRWLQWIQRYWVEIPENAADVMSYTQQKPWGASPGAGRAYTYNEYFTRAARGEDLPPLSHVQIFDSATLEDVYLPGIRSPLSAPAWVSVAARTKPLPSEIPMSADFLAAATAALPQGTIATELHVSWAATLGEEHGRMDKIARAINGVPEPTGHGIAKTEAEARASHQVWVGHLPPISLA